MCTCAGTMEGKAGLPVLTGVAPGVASVVPPTIGTVRTNTSKLTTVGAVGDVVGIGLSGFSASPSIYKGSSINKCSNGTMGPVTLQFVGRVGDSRELGSIPVDNVNNVRA